MADGTPARGAARNREATRAQLIAAARDVFRETGSPVMGVEQVVRRAGYTRGAFYSNFGSVDDLLFAVYEHDADAMVATVLDRVRATLRRRTVSLETIAGSLVTTLPDEETWLALRAVVVPRARHDPDVRRDLRVHTRHLVTALEPVLLDALAAAGRTATVGGEVITRAVIAAFVGTMAQATVLEEGTRLRRITVAAVLSGLSAPSG
ncbi:TetR/AcrR family transcriptional regulator [Jatrophihabitans fulvus]